MSSDDEIEQTNPRKKARHDATYKRNVIKKSRITGDAYVNHAGKEIQKLLPNIDCRCRRKCYNLVSDDDVLRHFNNFHNVSSKNEQDLFLQQNIERIEVSNRKQPSEKLTPHTLKPKSSTFKYYLPSVNSKKIPVCKSAFMMVFAVTSQRLRRIVNLLKEGKIPVDMRGKHPCKNAIPGEICLLIENHIKTFPVKISHYGSKEIKYLSAELNDIKKLLPYVPSEFESFYNELINNWPVTTADSDDENED